MAFHWNLRTKRDFKGEVWINVKDVELFAEKLRNDVPNPAEMLARDRLTRAAYRTEARR